MSGGMYGANAGGQGQAIFTDDVSLQVFMDVLKRLVSLSNRMVIGSLLTGFTALILIRRSVHLLHEELLRCRSVSLSIRFFY